MRRSATYGSNDLHLAQKHPNLRTASPWRFLLQVNPISRPFLLFAALAPNLSAAIAWPAMWIAMGFGALGLERVALVGGTFAYGVQYFRGVRRGIGSLRATMSDFGRYLSGCEGPELGFVLRFGKMIADIREDHDALTRADEKYAAEKGGRRHNVLGDAVQRIGFQMDVRVPCDAVFPRRAAALFRESRVANDSTSVRRGHSLGRAHRPGRDFRAWLRIDHQSRVHRVARLRVVPARVFTLGESIDAESRRSGSPMLEQDVHIGPGTTLLGPITIGAGTKITANVLLMRSVGPRSLVEAPAPTIRARKGADKTRSPQLASTVDEETLTEPSSERSTSRRG